MSIERISADEVKRASMAGVANRPNQRTGFGNAGMTPQELKERFSALAMLGVNKINEMIEAFGSDETEGELMRALYTHMQDPDDDRKRMSLAAWVRRVEELFSKVRTDSGVFHLVNTRITVDGVDPVADFGSYTVAPRSGDVALTTDFDLYKLTVEEIDGTPVITPEFIANIKGLDGADGKTPDISVAEEEGGHRVTMTLGTSVTEFFIADGRQGEKGDGLYFDKVYTSVAEMEAGFATDGVQLGRFVIISTEDVNDEDNSKFFVKTADGYRFVNDLSGAIGIQGPRGFVGPVGPRGATGARGSRWFFGNADPTGYISGAQYGDWYLNTATGVAFEYDMSAWTPRVSLRGPQGAQGVSPTIAVSDTGIGYQVTVTDKDGKKSFQLLHGKDGGGSDPRRNTLLCDAVLGWQHYGEGNYEMYAEMPLADTILPNTSYIVNGQQMTSDGDGDIEQEVTMSYGLRGIVRLSGKTVRLNILSEYDPYDECTTRVTVVGPGAFTCIAQLTALGTLGGEGWDEVGTETTVDALSLLPYRLVYLIRENGVTHTAVLDGDGNLPTVNVNTANKPLYVSITDGKLTVNGKYFTRAERGVTLTVLAETLDVGVSGSGGDSGGSTTGGGEKKVYYLAYGSQELSIPSTGTYLVKIEGTSSARAWFVFGDGYVQHSNEIACGGVSIYTGGGYLYVYPESQSVYVTVEPIAPFISCFIEGTPVLLRNPSTLELYEKPIEQVLPFEYAAFWNPEKGRLDATRVLAPPIAGDAEEFDRLYFDNGTELDVYGVQFFWNVDTDTLVDWAKMEPGTRVCTKDGDIVCFVRAEHIVPEAPVKHYTLLTYRGRYIAGGIVAGDKRDLIYPRMMAPERVRYWRMLNEADQNGLIKAHREGCRRRNWRYSRELHDALDPLKRRRRELEGRIGERKQFLADTDHRVIKFTEGVIDEAAFAPDRTRRAEARSDINRDEVEIVTVDGQIEAETERVRAEIAATWKPKYAGRFVGKKKVILEDEQ